MLDKSLSAAPDTGETPAADLPGMWERADYTDGLDEVRPATAVSDMGETPATAAQVWAHLGNAPDAHNLPAPTSITVYRSTDKAAIFLANDAHTLTDLHTWAAWLGAGPLDVRVYADEPGHVQRETSAEATWRGWTVTVRLLETVPVETLAVAFGQSGGAR